MTDPNIVAPLPENDSLEHVEWEYIPGRTKRGTHKIEAFVEPAIGQLIGDGYKMAGRPAESGDYQTENGPAYWDGQQWLKEEAGEPFKYCVFWWSRLWPETAPPIPPQPLRLYVPDEDAVYVDLDDQTAWDDLSNEWYS